MAADKSKRKTDLQLLLDAQAYLKMLLEDKVPNSLLAVAWENFYRVYDNLIRRFVVARGIPHSDVDDCVQEVWGEIAVRLFEFDRPADRPGLRAWLYALVRSKATNVFRSKARRPAVSLDQRKLAGHEHGDAAPIPRPCTSSSGNRPSMTASSRNSARICRRRTPVFCRCG